MDYDLKKAVNRFQFRFTKQENGDYKNFKPNHSDIEAINTILSWINRQKEDSVRNNHLFAKLYIYHLTMNIRHYQTTVLDDYPQKDLSRLLDKPLELFYQSFYNDLIDNQLNKLLHTETEKEDVAILKEYEDFKKTFTLGIVKSKLTDMISEALNRFK